MIRLQQRPLLGILGNPFGTTARAIALEGDHLLITKRGQPASVSLADVGEAPTFLKGALGTTLSLQASGHEQITLRGAGCQSASKTDPLSASNFDPVGTTEIGVRRGS